MAAATARANRIPGTRQLWRIGGAKSAEVGDGTFEINAFVQELAHLVQLVLDEVLGRQTERLRNQLDRARDGILVAFEELHEISGGQTAARLIELSGGTRELPKAHAELFLTGLHDVRERLLCIAICKRHARSRVRRSAKPFKSSCDRSMECKNRLASWVFDRVGLFVIRKVETPDSGLLLVALGDPINAAIVDELLAVYSATPGALAALVHRSLGISRPVVSTHLTQLRQRRVVRLLPDGTMSLRDPGPVALLLQTSRDFAKDAHNEGARDESALHYRTQRRVNKGLRQLEPSEADLADAADNSAAVPADPLATPCYADISAEDRAQALGASVGTTSRRGATAAGAQTDREALSQAEIEELRRITRASFPFDTPWPSEAERRAARRQRWTPQESPKE